MSSRARKALGLALKLGLAAGLLGYLFASGRIRPADLAPAVAAPGALAFAVVAVLANILACAVRWWILVRGQGVRLSLADACRLTFIGNFFNTFMPGAVGGDPFKMYYIVLRVQGGKKLEAAATVAFDRVIGLGALILLMACALAVAALAGARDETFGRVADVVGAKLRPLALPLALALGAALVAAALLLHPAGRGSRPGRFVAERLRVAAIAGRLMAAVATVAREPGRAAAALGISLVVHAINVTVFFGIGRALGEVEVPYGRYFLVVPAGLIVNGIPGPPAGIGLGEWAFENLFAVATGRAVSLGAEICLVWRAVTLAWNQVGAIFYILHRHEMAPLAAGGPVGLPARGPADGPPAGIEP